ncbi:unnamed protein product [Prunus armeniaca]
MGVKQNEMIMVGKLHYLNRLGDTTSDREMKFDAYGFPLVNFNRLRQTEDTFILASQATQVLDNEELHIRIYMDEIVDEDEPGNEDEEDVES